MPYRRTETVVRHLAEREQAIRAAAMRLASEDGLAAVQIAAVADGAGVAAGTVYRYFPSKTELVAAVIAEVAARELAAMRAAADGAPGPLSALAAAVVTFAAHALAARRMIWAMTGEPVAPNLDRLRLDFRGALAAVLAMRIDAAIAGGHLPAQDSKLVAPAIVGALLESLVGPLAPPAAPGAGAQRAAVQTATLFALRALGVIDARARGLVVQCALPVVEQVE